MTNSVATNGSPNVCAPAFEPLFVGGRTTQALAASATAAVSSGLCVLNAYTSSSNTISVASLERGPSFRIRV
jgi:hypothetical protein